MARKITIKPGMSKYQIRRQIEKAFEHAVDNSYFEWKCGHGYTHKIRVGSLRKGVKHSLYCGCTVEGS